MLSREENELVTRVGPGTPTGDLLRQYWQPVLFPWEVEADGRPQRVRLLGEDLIAFRDTEGRVGLLGDHCAHRGASLYFGRNEESGLRCVYHGWKYDVAGLCLDMPNEPPESNFKDKIHQAAYPCREHGGVVWAYLGPSAQRELPPLPELEWALVPDSHRYVSKRVQSCNWLQALEGDIDQSHVSFLHSQVSAHHSTPAIESGAARQNVDRWRSQDKHPHFEVLDTDYGVLIGARRNADADSYYWRITQFMMPYFSFTGPYGDNPTRQSRAWVPIDDEHVMLFGALFHPLRPLNGDELARCHAGGGASFVGDANFLAPTTAPHGRWQPKAGRANDYLFDVEAQRTKIFSGIPEFWAQDAAMQEGMGPIYERWNEHLGTSDSAIIQVRKRLLNAAKALRDQGSTPPGIGDAGIYRVRGAAVVLPRDASWVDTTEDVRTLVPGTNPAGA